MGRITKTWGCKKLSSSIDVLDRDLIQYMYGEHINNEDAILRVLKERHNALNSNMRDTQEWQEPYDLFNDIVKKELAKHKPGYKVDKLGLGVSVVACSLLATFAFLVLPTQYSWVVAAGCFWPICVTAIKGKKHGRINQRNTEDKRL